MSNSRIQYFSTSKSLLNPIKIHLGIEMHVRMRSTGLTSAILQPFSYLCLLSWKPGLATYFRFSFRFFKKSNCQLLAKVCARSIG